MTDEFRRLESTCEKALSGMQDFSTSLLHVREPKEEMICQGVFEGQLNA